MTNDECMEVDALAGAACASSIRHSSFVIRHSRRRAASRTGAMMVLIAICLPLFLIAAAFAVDVAYMQLTRTELRTATDAAARAGAKTLSLTQIPSNARAAAREAARRNRVAGDALLVRNSQIEVGHGAQPTESSRFAFTPGGSQLNAVRVTGLRTQTSAAGPVGLFLGHIMGVREFQPRHVATSTQLDREICLVVDRSGSMMWDTDGDEIPAASCSPPQPASRWMSLNAAVAGFLDELEQTPQQEQCSLASYSSSGSGCGIRFNTSDLNVSLNYNYQLIRDEMARLSSRPVQGSTAIGAGVYRGIEALTGDQARRYAVKTMVLMTDGLHNSGTEPIIPAREAANLNITINTVTFGSDADIRRMRAVAEATGGQHFHAPTRERLEEIFREIASTLPVMLTE
jgi:Ca-activated chloride channel homolog